MTDICPKCGHDLSNATLRQLLTDKQLNLVRLMTEGNSSNRDLAEAAGLSESTVKNYLGAIFDKMGCDSRMTLAVRYVREEEVCHVESVSNQKENRI